VKIDSITVFIETFRLARIVDEFLCMDFFLFVLFCFFFCFCFCSYRLRFPDAETHSKPRPKYYIPDFAEGPRRARIRELHVYGNLVEVSRDGTKGKTAQHTGVGKFLMGYAELLSAVYGFEETSVISGVGVREVWLSPISIQILLT
jgi:hypothetical protein